MKIVSRRPFKITQYQSRSTRMAICTLCSIRNCLVEPGRLQPIKALRGSEHNQTIGPGSSVAYRQDTLLQCHGAKWRCCNQPMNERGSTCRYRVSPECNNYWLTLNKWRLLWQTSSRSDSATLGWFRKPLWDEGASVWHRDTYYH